MIEAQGPQEKQPIDRKPTTFDGGKRARLAAWLLDVRRRGLARPRCGSDVADSPSQEEMLDAILGDRAALQTADLTALEAAIDQGGVRELLVEGEVIRIEVVVPVAELARIEERDAAGTLVSTRITETWYPPFSPDDGFASVAGTLAASGLQLLPKRTEVARCRVPSPQDGRVVTSRCALSSRAEKRLARVVARQVKKTLRKLLADGTRQEDSDMTIDEVCGTYRMSRTKFYRILRDPSSGLEDVVVRIPPVPTGRILIPRVAFEEWLKRSGR